MYKILIFSFSLLLSFSISAQENLKLTIDGRLADSEGLPVSGATISAEGSKTVLSNATGDFSIEVKSEATLVIEADEYQTLMVKNPEGQLGQTINMVKLPYQMREKDLVNLPFGTLKKRQISGTVTTLDPSEILSYDARQGVLEAIRGRVPGVMGASNIHGIGDATIIVDGIPRIDIGLFSLHEIEQITVLRDAASRMLYGVQADQGIILITTKKGKPYKKELRFRVESGMSKPISYPNYLNSADYMTSYNEALSNDLLYGNISSDQYNSKIYAQGVIDSTRAGLDNIKFPDEDYYNSTYLRILLRISPYSVRPPEVMKTSTIIQILA